jgi:aryl-alcohol dehydrogenase-like predicted oxidoreductase
MHLKTASLPASERRLSSVWLPPNKAAALRFSVPGCQLRTGRTCDRIHCYLFRMPNSDVQTTRLGRSDLMIAPICLGTNVFGWTADEQRSFAVLDAFVDGGGNLLDSADSYSSFVPGNKGGESETIIGNWLKSRGRRDDVLIATKVGRAPGVEGLSRETIRQAVEDSLRRLQIDCIDLYYAHADDPDTPLEETLSTFDELVREGKVRHIAASNYSASRLREAISVSAAGGFPRYEALQPHYNLLERNTYEGELADLCVGEEISCLPYFALAKGFLTGKYRESGDVGDGRRAQQASEYLDARGLSVLEGLVEIAALH